MYALYSAPPLRNFLPFPNAPVATIDFETRSPADLKKLGAYLYSRHFRTQILCVSYMLPGWKEVVQWRRGEPLAKLEYLFKWIRRGGLVEAHNSYFERCIWENTVPREWASAPPIRPEQWRCSAAKAAAFALPRGLAGACKAALGKALKDEEGKKAMLHYAKPRKVTREKELEKIRKRQGITDPDQPIYFEPEEEPERAAIFYAYNMQDVRAEHELSAALPDLSPFELSVWHADQRANMRGVRVDTELCLAAQFIDREMKVRWNAELFELTGIKAGTQRAKIKEWLNARGAPIQDTTAPTLAWFIAHGGLTGAVLRVIEIARDINKTSVAKFKRILELAERQPDGSFVVRELIMYHGASTGRWTGKGIQVQNFPRGSLGGVYPWNLSMAEAVALVKSRNLKKICERFKNGEVLELLSSVARGALIPRKGKNFACADYSAIEARLVMWLAGEVSALALFASGGDIYCAMATTLYRRPITKKDKKERLFGKTAILALGYGMGFVTFALRVLQDEELSFTHDEVKAICGDKYNKVLSWVIRRLFPQFEDFDKPEQFYAMNAVAAADKLRIQEKARCTVEDVLHILVLCKYVVDTYRKKYTKVVELWSAMEVAAMEAIRKPGNEVECSRFIWHCDGDRVLRCWLPTGRALIYMRPKVRVRKTPWGEMLPGVFFEGVSKKTGTWGRRESYGASFVENGAQGLGREIMARAFVAADASPYYDPTLTVHDEMLAETERGTIDDFDALMVDAGPEFDGCPITVESAILAQYQK